MLIGINNGWRDENGKATPAFVRFLHALGVPYPGEPEYRAGVVCGPTIYPNGKPQMALGTILLRASDSVNYADDGDFSGFVGQRVTDETGAEIATITAAWVEGSDIHGCVEFDDPEDEVALETPFGPFYSLGLS